MKSSCLWNCNTSLIMNTNLIIALTFFLTINLVAFLVMWIDKLQSKKEGHERISEGMLFFLASIFGSVGVYGGMFAFRHKTQKWYFLVGIPLLIVQNSVFLYFIYNYWIKYSF